MTTFVTSDIHFNHRNILQYCPHRGGPEVSDEKVARMNEMIIQNWNSEVLPEDEVYILGDVAMGLIEKAPALIRRLNGKKYLVKGNHDKTLTKPREELGGLSYADGLFEWVKDVHEMNYTTDDGRKVMLFMSHYPHTHWPWQGKGVIHLHGHLHGNPSGVEGRIMDVGMDTFNLHPYPLDYVVKQMLKIEPRDDHHG